MNTKITTLTVSLLFFVLTFLNGQDLIHRTLNHQALKSNKSANFIAKNIALEKEHATFISTSWLEASPTKHLSNEQDYLSEAVYLNLKLAELTKTFQARPAHIKLQIPVSTQQSFELDLMQVEVLTPDFALKTSDGQHFTREDVDVIFYRGIISGDPNSTATITVHENGIKGLITDQDGNYVLAPITHQLEQYILYNDKNLKATNTLQCGAVDLMNIGTLPPAESSDDQTRQQPSPCIEVYVECDYSMYQAHFSSTFFLESFVTNLFAEVATLYANEDINIFLSEGLIWTSPDPYVNYNTGLSIVDGFAEYRQNNYNGRLAHLLSARSFDIGGGAWINQLCAEYSTINEDLDGDGIPELHHIGPYGFSMMSNTFVLQVPFYSFNVQVFTHELGHNFGSPHTQACAWGASGMAALDDCVPTEGGCAPGPTPTNGGTIMSYCNEAPSAINFNNGFGQEPGDLIRNFYNNAPCQSTCTLPCRIYCPSSTTIDCGQDYDDLNITGNITSSGDCNLSPVTYSDVFNLTGCAGYIQRELKIMNTTNIGILTVTCNQTITIIEDSGLPIEIIAFDAEKTSKETALLTWKTVAELDFSHFVIERSFDGIFWDALGKVSSNGSFTNTQSYQFEDHQPLLGNNFYRLKLVNEQGMEDYTDINLLVFKTKNNITINNPVANTLAMTIQSIAPQQMEFVILDVQGNWMKQKTVAVQAGQYNLTWDMGDLVSGVYFIRVMDDHQFVLKMVKM